MGEILTQAEIEALLNGTSRTAANAGDIDDSELTLQEIDALGEIGNISMGTAATTLSLLLNQKVTITTPAVEVTTWQRLAKEYPIPFVAVRIEYTNGLEGSNLMIIQNNDVEVITDLMLGGDGKNIAGEINEFHLSAISEAMNQMVGSSSTSLSSMLNKKIEISPPQAFMMQFSDGKAYEKYLNAEETNIIVKIAFKIVVGDLIDSQIMQLLPVNFARSLISSLLNEDVETDESQQLTAEEPSSYVQQPVQQTVRQPVQEPVYEPVQQPVQHQPVHQQQPVYSTQHQQADIRPPQIKESHLQDIKRQQPQQPLMTQNHVPEKKFDYQTEFAQQPVNIQPVQFQPFDDETITLEKKNISVIMDVPLQVTVELGRTQKMIKDILEFGPGSIIELDKLAGDSVDILANGKVIAKGEVVVIDESFGVRITDIMPPSKRL